jgi:transcription termination/antitermination protein NusG
MGALRPDPGLEALKETDMSDQAQNPSAEPAESQVADTASMVSAEVAAPVVAPSNKRWYVVHAYSGMEKAVERNLRERIDRSEMQDKFGRILVPMEEVVELKNGKKAVTERRFFPGYVLVEMEMADDSWHLVKHTSKVTGFVGGAKNRPSPISEAEVMKIVNQMQEGVEKPRPKVQWVVGELVRVKEGPFTDFNGAVEEVNYDKSKVRVSVTIFGRATPVELDFSQVEKV